VSYNYDPAGRLGDKDGQNLAFTGNLADSTGNLADSTSRTYSTGIVYDAASRMTQEQFGTTTATTTAVYNKLSYNTRGQLVAVLASTSGNDTTFNRGKIVNDYGTTDNNGNLKQQTVYIPNNDQNTSPTSWYQLYDYDSLNRLGKMREYNSSNTLLWQQAYTFDLYGNRTIDVANTTDGIPKPNFSVNTANNRLGVPSGQSGTMSYDSAGNLTTDTYSAAAVTRAYDAENRMTSETQTNSYVAGSYSYDGDGRRVKRTVGSTTTWQVYGLGGELLAEYAQNGSASTPQKEYGYRNGQLLVTAEAATASAPAPSGLGASPANSSVALSWSAASGATNYRIEREGAGGSYASIGTTTSTSFTDSGAGNTSAHLYKVCAADGSNSCTSGYSNEVLGMAVSFTDPTLISFADDPLNATPIKAAHLTELRTAVNAVRSLAGLSAASWTNPTLTPQVTQISADDVRDLRTKLDEALTALGIQTSAYTDATLLTGQYGTQVKRIHIAELRQRATSGIGGSGSSAGASVQIHWLVTDQLGTPRMIFDQSGSLAGVSRHDYLPFGEEVPANFRTGIPGYGANDNVRQKFTQKERDNETGLDYFGARYYASTQGRFTSADPMSGEPRHPQSWNRYAYVLNNPLKLVDPDGLRWAQRIRYDGWTEYKWFATEDAYNEGTNSNSQGYEGWTAVSFDETQPYEYEAPGIGGDLHNTYRLNTDGTHGYAKVLDGVGGSMSTDWNAQFAIGGGIKALFEAGDYGLAAAVEALASRTASQGVLRGLYGEVSVEAVEAAAKAGGPTVEVFTRLDGAPAADKALHMAYEEAGTAARSAGQMFKGQVPRALVEQLKRSGLAFEKTMEWKGAAGATKAYTELQVMPQAARFIVPYLK